MRMEGYGGIAGGGYSGNGLRVPTTPVVHRDYDKPRVTKSPFPPITEQEGARLLVRKGRPEKKPRKRQLPQGERRLAGRRSPSRATVREMVRLFTEEEWTTTQIAERVGVSRMTVQAYLERERVYVRGRRPKVKVSNDE